MWSLILNVFCGEEINLGTILVRGRRNPQVLGKATRTYLNLSTDPPQRQHCFRSVHYWLTGGVIEPRGFGQHLTLPSIS